MEPVQSPSLLQFNRMIDQAVQSNRFQGKDVVGFNNNQELVNHKHHTTKTRSPHFVTSCNHLKTVLENFESDSLSQKKLSTRTVSTRPLNFADLQTRWQAVKETSHFHAASLAEKNNMLLSDALRDGSDRAYKNALHQIKTNFDQMQSLKVSVGAKFYAENIEDLRLMIASNGTNNLERLEMFNNTIVSPPPKKSRIQTIRDTFLSIFQDIQQKYQSSIIHKRVVALKNLILQHLPSLSKQECEEIQEHTHGMQRRMTPSNPVDRAIIEELKAIATAIKNKLHIRSNAATPHSEDRQTRATAFSSDVQKRIVRLEKQEDIGIDQDNWDDFIQLLQSTHTNDAGETEKNINVLSAQELEDLRIRLNLMSSLKTLSDEQLGQLEWAITRP